MPVGGLLLETAGRGGARSARRSRGCSSICSSGQSSPPERAKSNAMLMGMIMNPDSLLKAASRASPQLAPRSAALETPDRLRANQYRQNADSWKQSDITSALLVMFETASQCLDRKRTTKRR